MIEYNLKDSSCINSVKENGEGGKVFELIYGTFLGDVLNMLPHGRIDKRETGIGATTLELKCPRNSIIVQPLRITASSKAEGRDDVFYFGNKKRSSTGRISTKGIDREIELKEYLNNSDFPYKKISVVADSLPKLIVEMEEVGIDVFNSYFLLVDEIDSIQKDSAFRKRMEPCMSIYKQFSSSSRAVISATLLSFSDPELSSEPLTEFRFVPHKKGSVNLIRSSKINETAYEVIYSLLNKGGKILVALNSLNDIKYISKELVKNGYCTYDEITSLYGANNDNHKKMQDFAPGEIVKGSLPNRINFITSAYFTGYDLKDKYHLIIVSDSHKGNTMLSEFEIYQIAGRSRDRSGLLSFKVIYNLKSTIEKSYSKDECIDIAERSLKTLDCLSINYQGSSLGLREELSIMNQFANINVLGGFSFLKEDGNGVFDISYLSLDAYLEKVRVINDVYSKKGYLTNFLNDYGYYVNECIHSPEFSIDKKLEDDTKSKLLVAIDYLTSRGRVTNNDMESYLKADPDRKVKELFSKYSLLRSNGVSKEKRDSILKSIKSVTRFNSVMEKIEIYYDDSLREKILFKQYFSIGTIYSKKQLEELLRKIYCDVLLSTSRKQFAVKVAVKQLKKHATLKRVQKNVNNKKVDYFKLLNFNPLGL